MADRADLRFTSSFDPLERAVTLIDDAFRPGAWSQPNHIVMLEAADDASSLAIFALPPNLHPLDVLLGFVAPDDCLVMGVVGFGWCATAEIDRAAGTCDIRPSEHPERRRARTITLVHRGGDTCGMLAIDDGRVHDRPSEGVVSDALRRSLGLTTAPPSTSSAELFARRWLTNVLDTAEVTPDMSWDDVAILHPAFSSGPPDAAEQLIERAHALARAYPWDVLRTQIAAGTVVEAAVSADLAGWMDDGMFSRWLLAQEPPLSRLLAALEHSHPADVLEKIGATLEALGLGH